MALHIRDRIVDAIATLLTGLTTTGGRVYVDRDSDNEPLGTDQFPGLTIQQRDDTAENLTLGGRVFQRALNLEVVAHVKLVTGTLARKQLNLINQEIEAALFTDRSLGGLCKYIKPGNFDFSTTGDADLVVARMQMQFQVIYLYAEGVTDTPL